MKSKEIIREKRFIIAFLVLLIIGFVYIMKPFLMAMLLAGIIAVIFFPLYQKICCGLNQRRRLASLITTFLILFIIILPAGIVITILANQIIQYVSSLNITKFFLEFFSTDFYSTSVAPFLYDLETKYQIEIDLFSVLTNLGKQIARYIGSYSPAVFLGTASFLFDFLIMLAGIYFLFLDGPALMRVVFDVSPLREHYEILLSKRLRDTIDASIYGYLVTGLFMAIVASFVFGITGMQGYVVLGTITFFMSMVPIVGAAGVWVPVCIWLFSTGQTGAGFVVGIGGAFITFIDYFLKPILIKGKTKIHPLLIFFSLFGGITVFGLLGILFGPVITALLIAVVNIYREEMI